VTFLLADDDSDTNFQKLSDKNNVTLCYKSTALCK